MSWEGNGLIDHATSAEDTIVRVIECISVYACWDINNYGVIKSATHS